jgi:hypothetical protein
LVELKLKCLNTADPNPIQIWHDLYHGLELDGILCDADTQTATVNIFVEAGGYGAISLTMTEALDENIEGEKILEENCCFVIFQKETQTNFF